MEVKDPSGIEQQLQYEFKDKKLLLEALRHSSYVNELADPPIFELDVIGTFVRCRYCATEQPEPELALGTGPKLGLCFGVLPHFKDFFKCGARHLVEADGVIGRKRGQRRSVCHSETPFVVLRELQPTSIKKSCKALIVTCSVTPATRELFMSLNDFVRSLHNNGTVTDRQAGHYIDCSRVTIWRWRTGKNTLSTEKLEALYQLHTGRTLAEDLPTHE